jgi:antitoxin component of MazEF toxin-antitoxin module
MLAQGYLGVYMEKTFRTKVKKVGRSNVVILPKKMMDMLHWSDSEKVDVTPLNDRIIIKPSNAWTQEKQVEGFKKAFEMIDALTEEEKNMLPSGWSFEKQAEGFRELTEEIMAMSDEEANKLPSGLEFEKEYRIKWRDTSDIDRKFDEML